MATDKFKKYIVTGASGLLGQELVSLLDKSDKEVLAVTLNHPVLKQSERIREVRCDLTDCERIAELIKEFKPDVLIHTAGLTNVDLCEKDPDLAQVLNTDIPIFLSTLCRDFNAKYVFISTDHITGGDTAFFTEEDAMMPLNVYAQTKADAETGVLERNPESLIIRTNFFGKGPSWRKSFSDWLWQKMASGENIPAFTDSYFSPIGIPYLNQSIYDLVQKNGIEIFQVGGSERLSKHDFAMAFAAYFGFDQKLVHESSVHNAGLSAPRPLDMSMDVQKVENFLGRKMPSLQESFQSIEQDYV